MRRRRSLLINKPSQISTQRRMTPKATPTPIPAFAPVERDEFASEDAVGVELIVALEEVVELPVELGELLVEETLVRLLEMAELVVCRVFVEDVD